MSAVVPFWKRMLSVNFVLQSRTCGMGFRVWHRGEGLCARECEVFVVTIVHRAGFGGYSRVLIAGGVRVMRLVQCAMFGG